MKQIEQFLLEGQSPTLKIKHHFFVNKHLPVQNQRNEH